MNKIILTILLIFLGNQFFVRSAEDDELLSVVVFFRHGDRSPERSFPTDKFFNLENFPMGYGQLTNKGLNRQYELGQWFRERYHAFLPSQYAPNDILVRSTDIDRTLMSATANLAGLYPPQGDQVWNKDLLWRPMPVHTVERSEDAVLAMKKACPKLEASYNASKNSTFYQRINEEYSTLYQYLTEQTGMDITDIDNVRFIRSVFYCYTSYDSSYLPSWAGNLNQTDLDFLSGVSYASYTFTETLARLTVGPFFDYLFGYFDGVSSNVDGTPKFLMLSAHDTTLASVLDAMGVYNYHPPGFAETVIWELRRDSQGKNYINLLNRRSDGELLSLTVLGCSLDCQLEDYKKIMERYTVDETTWEAECLI